MNTIAENAVDKLINQCTNSLEDNTFSMNIVGNRMHYPMLITTNGDNALMTKEIFNKSFRRMWPQTHDNIVFVKNEFSDNLRFIDLQTNSAISIEELQNSLDQLRLKHGVFENFLKLCLYNIIDTSVIDSIEQFIKQYSLIEELKTIVGMSSLCMSIVLLDDSITKKDLSNSIREFLSQNSLYDGNIVIATKSIIGEMYNIEDIIKVAASVIALSNNDAVSNYDDDDYNERINTIYDGSTLTVAHSLLKRPNHKIVIQMLNILINHCSKILNDKNDIYTVEKWKNILGIEHGVIGFFEEELNKLDFPCNLEELQYIPYKNLPDEDLDFNNILFSKFSNYIFEDSFENYIQKQCTEKLINSNILDSLICNYQNKIRVALTANHCIGLTDIIIDEIINLLVEKTPEKNMPFLDYYRSKVKSVIREKYLYPEVKSFLKELRNNSEQTITDFNLYKNAFTSKLPLDGFNELGVFYSNITDSYINSIRGNEQIKTIISPGNGSDEFNEQLIVVFENILETNEEKFNLSFIDEWVQRLNLTGDVILREIEKTFNKDFEKRLFLSGNYPKQNKLDTYIFHTFDNDSNPTQLLKHLKDTFKGIEHVQFINSGYDDFVESIRFVDCSGSRLIL